MAATTATVQILKETQTSILVKVLGTGAETAATLLDASELTYARSVSPLVFAGASSVVVDIDTDTITFNGHGLVSGEKVLYQNGGGTSITGLTSGNNYYAILVSTSKFKLASSYASAIAGTAVDLTALGVGVSHTLTPNFHPLVLREARWSVAGTAVVSLLWDATSDVPFMKFSGNGTVDFKKDFSSFVENNAGAGVNGDVLITSADANYMLILDFKKMYEGYDHGNKYEPTT